MHAMSGSVSGHRQLKKCHAAAIGTVLAMPSERAKNRLHDIFPTSAMCGAGQRGSGSGLVSTAVLSSTVWCCIEVPKEVPHRLSPFPFSVGTVINVKQFRAGRYWERAASF